jgi:hypothetical protein
MWALPIPMVGSTSLTDRDCLLRELDSKLKRDLVERPTFPTNTSYVAIKYKLSDLQVTLINASTQLPVSGYIQTAPTHKIDSGNLLRWVAATVRVSLTDSWLGTTPIANGPDKCLHIGMCKCTARLPSANAVEERSRCAFIFFTCNLDLLIWPSHFHWNLDPPLSDLWPHISLLQAAL